MNSCPVLNIKDEQKLFVAELAINKENPFANNKNNFNDALIIRNFIDYVVDRIIYRGTTFPFKYDFIFVSKNLQDFVDSNTNEIFPEILKGVNIPLRIMSVTEFGQAIKEKDNVVDEFDEWFEMEMERQIEYEVEVRMGK